MSLLSQQTHRPSLFPILLGVFALLSLTATAQAQEAHFLRGDVDSNGEVDMSDANVVINWLFRGGDEPGCLDAADANDDGEVNISDASAILGYLFMGDELAEPSVEAAVDDTEDDLDCLVAWPEPEPPGPACGDAFEVEATGWYSGNGATYTMPYHWRAIGMSCSLSSSIRGYYQGRAHGSFTDSAERAVECPESCPAVMTESEYQVEVEENASYRRFGSSQMRCSGSVTARLQGTATVQCGD